MKKLILLLIFGFLVLSCSDDDSSGTPLSNTPTAKAEYDNSNYGIYKGVFVGSSGSVLININNDGTVSATIVVDGKTYNFTTTESVSENEAISGLTFTSGSISFDFSVEDDGSNPVVTNINFSGHPYAEISVVKEDSEHIVKCYQGTYSGDSSGTFNFTISENELYGLASVTSDGQQYSIELEGIVNENAIVGSIEDAGSFAGTINGDNVSGTWSGYDDENGTWTGKRKL